MKLSHLTSKWWFPWAGIIGLFAAALLISGGILVVGEVFDLPVVQTQKNPASASQRGLL